MLGFVYRTKVGSTHLSFPTGNPLEIITRRPEKDQINILSNPSTPGQVEKLGSFIKQSLELRTGGS
jgi:hypothetical protein